MCHFVVTEHSDLTLQSKSQANLDIDVTIGERLRAERKKLRLNQTAMATTGGVSLQTQHRYEAGGLPSTEYLLRIGAAGADWYWIITGERIEGVTLDEKSFELVDCFRRLTPPIQATILAHIRQLAALSDDTPGRLHESGSDYRPGPD